MAKALFALLLGALALTLQGVALLRFAEFLDAGRPLAESILWQVAGALAGGCWMACVGIRQHPGQWRSLFAHGFLLCLLLPVVGQTLIGSTALGVLCMPAVRRVPPVHFIPLPRIVPSLIRQVTYGAGLRLLGQLRDDGLSPDERLQAMVGLRDLPSNVSGGLLRMLLADPAEEIRLLAYGIFEAAENRIRQEILIARQLLDAAQSDTEHAQLAARLAELHWELVYQDLVHGELRQFTLRCVRQYAHEALMRDAKQGSLWFLLGRSALIDADPEQAREYLSRAQEHGFPAHRLAATLAEADFQQGQYAAVPRSLAVLKGFTPTPYESVKRYWLT
ncbi:hypothetical protein [Pollutimonas sp. M17]|jgi:hypothetical protein|uniref:hypothetical protein n=1 Tax=Pollutimonas sp. M17 TaxID=2962065 RepID=UPI0021F3F7D1|nr:hypothetical protein [Pollutimonas sp. M17]UYO93590.1 hypothetical protein OEG81_17215 [Pollutimonas sp. M17]